MKRPWLIVLHRWIRLKPKKSRVMYENEEILRTKLLDIGICNFQTHHCCQTRLNVWPSILVEKNIRLDVRNLFFALTKLLKFWTFKVLMTLEQEPIRNTRIEKFILQSRPTMPRILLLAYPSYQSIANLLKQLKQNYKPNKPAIQIAQPSYRPT